MHPNWRALATTSYRYQPFISEQQNSSESEKPKDDYSSVDHKLSGKDISNLYEEIVNSPSTCKISPMKVEVPKLKSSYSSSVHKSVNFNQFCREVQVNNVDEVKKIASVQQNYVNETDSFGWTPLMMAACDGAAGSFRTLLDLGADLSLKNRKGQTAFTLAQSTNQSDIMLAIRDHYQKRSTEEEIQNPGLNRIKPFYCELCEEKFIESSFKEHQTSTLHQFNLEHHEFPTRFGLSESNRGFQMMIKQGWDKSSGLGPTSSGHLFPVKTSIREFRTGLGVEQNDLPRVTHFKPNDVSAIKRLNKPKPYTRRDRERDLYRNRRRQKKLRNDLS